MCGILGMLPPIQEELFEKSLNTLSHRGPDDYGIFSDDQVVLGHRRLSIVDLSMSGHQPMSFGKDDKNNRYHIVFNGEIYNYLELKMELISKGYVFHTQSDTEVVLASYDYWGQSCLNRFNGMWALAIWDSKEKRLFLSRDRFGKKPLFYSFVKLEGKLHFVFASEMKAIYPFLQEVHPTKNFYNLVSLRNIFNYEKTEECLVEGIKRFPHSSFAYFDPHSFKLDFQRYYCMLDYLPQHQEHSYQQAVKNFRELFLDSVKIRMRSDTSVGTALSGGLDSSATICAMSYLHHNNVGGGDIDRMQKDWQHAFIACFPGTPLDETKYAKSVVDHLGIQATYLNIDPTKYWNDIEKYFYLFEDLYLTSPIPMIATYQAVKKMGVSVTLDGHGADELFSGYGHIIEALTDCRFNLKKIHNVLDTLNQTRQTQNGAIGMYMEVLKYLCKKVGKKCLGLANYSQDRHHPNFKKMDNFSQNLYVIFYESILPTLLRNYDRYSMINGVEIRMPFMDHRIVEYVFSLPFDYKFSNGYTKILIRDALKDLMPQNVVWRKSKIGFNSPILQWMQKSEKDGGLKEWFLDTCHSKDFLECSLLANPKILQEKIIFACDDKNQNLNFSLGEQIWTELNPYLWKKSLKFAIRF